MTPNPTRVASRYMSAGILQAPPAMVRAVSAWVISTVAATKLKDVKAEEQEFTQQVQGRKTALSAGLREVKLALESGMKVRALYKLVYGDDGLWRKCREQGMSQYFWGDLVHPPRFKQFSAQYKAGNKPLRVYLANARRFMLGRDEISKDRFQRFANKKEALEGLLVRGGKSPLKNKTKEKVFLVSKYMKGWRYKSLFEDTERIRRQQKAQKMRFLEEQTQNRMRKDGLSREEVQKQKWWKQLSSFIESSAGDDGKPAFDEVIVEISPEKARRAAAQWRPFLRKVVVYFPVFRFGMLIDTIEDLEIAVEHELQHMVQTLMQETLKVETAGLPRRRSLTPQYKQWMSRPGFTQDEKTTEAIKDLREQGYLHRRVVEPSKIPFHTLDDIEFFTNLQTHIRYAEPLLKDLRGKTRDNAIDIILGII